MANVRQKLYVARSRGRPVVQDPKSKRVTIRFTEKEHQKTLHDAGGKSLTAFVRSIMLGRGPINSSEQAKIGEAWRTLDLLTESVIRIHEAVQTGRRPDEDDLGALLGQVLDALDEVRVLLLETAPAS